jgi:hypothetical protein
MLLTQGLVLLSVSRDAWRAAWRGELFLLQPCVWSLLSSSISCTPLMESDCWHSTPGV